MPASTYKDKDGGVLLSFSGVWVSWAHTVVAYSMLQPSAVLWLVLRRDSFSPHSL